MIFAFAVPEREIKREAERGGLSEYWAVPLCFHGLVYQQHFAQISFFIRYIFKDIFFWEFSLNGAKKNYEVPKDEYPEVTIWWDEVEDLIRIIIIHFYLHWNLISSFLVTRIRNKGNCKYDKYFKSNITSI